MPAYLLARVQTFECPAPSSDPSCDDVDNFLNVFNNCNGRVSFFEQNAAYTVANALAVPEPGTFALIGSGLLVLFGCAENGFRRRAFVARMTRADRLDLLQFPHASHGIAELFRIRVPETLHVRRVHILNGGVHTR